MAPPRLTSAERTRIYGTGSGVAVTTPWGITVRCHPLVAGVFAEACRRADRASNWKPRRIDSYAYRPIRGSSSLSLHAHALAWDFFITPPGFPPPGGVWNPVNGVPPAFAQPFKDLGFTWGNDFTSRKDVPHIEWAGAPPTGTYQEEDDVTEADLKLIGKKIADESDKTRKALVAEVQKQTNQIDRYAVWQMRQAGVSDDDIERILGKSTLPPA